MTAPARPAVGPVRGYLDYYLTSMRIAIATQFQYRVANYFYMIGMVAEPVIYLVVWSTIARQQGGEVGGITPGQFAAYYIVWTLVRNMNIIFTPYGWEERIRTGELSGMLLRPVHPIHADLGFFAGWKFVVIVLWLPIAVVLSALFQPDLQPRPIDVVVFAFAIWGAYLIRSVNYWILGMVTFWTTRVGPIFQLVFTAELLLSGRLVPLSLMPDWAQRLADVLPFKWTFGFPIEALVGRLPAPELLGGLAMQALWIAIGAIGVRVVWRFAVRHYGAVGG
ncbi:MAG TPA: ABC-2 family transporter protein [Verrucomicrobiae bacterium]|nr:ABC-2 family transporter protein [Verrucomicrobiae bacterium]